MTRTKPRTARGTSRGRGRRKDHHPMTDDTGMRDYTRQLFAEHEDDNWPTAGSQPATPAPADPMKGNHVPREGAVTTPGLTGDAEAREWTRNLFDRAALELP